MRSPVPYSFVMRLALLITLALVLGGSLAGTPASAQTVNAPPGLSGVDEYLETVPGAEGAERPGAGQDPADGRAPAEEVDARAETVLSAATRRELERAGADGQAVRRLAATNSPRESSSAANAQEVSGLRLEGGDKRGTAGAVASVLTGSAGAGLVLPLGLALATLALAMGALARRRREVS